MDAPTGQIAEIVQTILPPRLWLRVDWTGFNAATSRSCELGKPAATKTRKAGRRGRKLVEFDMESRAHDLYVLAVLASVAKELEGRQRLRFLPLDIQLCYETSVPNPNWQLLIRSIKFEQTDELGFLLGVNGCSMWVDASVNQRKVGVRQYDLNDPNCFTDAASDVENWVWDRWSDAYPLRLRFGPNTQ